MNELVIFLFIFVHAFLKSWSGLIVYFMSRIFELQILDP